ncbi:hypothetical protein [Paraburkholderia flagellata]|uniref:hypothetical protein n=1 Tax=Paraburkholderia flagellata TaxID=2883241 RepID=UPI001F373140|nr:hypothetical protein [Paraburkholderia flagellata]
MPLILERFRNTQGNARSSVDLIRLPSAAAKSGTTVALEITTPTDAQRLPTLALT